MGDTHVVDRPEVLLTAVEVRRNGQSVAEVVRIDQIAGTTDMEDDGNVGVLGPRPHGVQTEMAR